jgi:hypothetical protein
MLEFSHPDGNAGGRKFKVNSHSYNRGVAALLFAELKEGKDIPVQRVPAAVAPSPASGSGISANT